MKVIIVGGGPIGVEAALYGTYLGFEVQLFERGELCANVRAWRHIGLFTEWARNRSPLATRLLSENNIAPADDNTTSTGAQLADYVAQIAALEPLRGRVHCHSEVVSITRERTLKSDFYDDQRRAQNPFRLLIRDQNGERTEHADVVIDATGVYATPNPLGNGGAMCVGENALRDFIDYALPDATGRDRARFLGRHTLVVGSGHSAASTLRSVAELFDDNASTQSSTRMTWVVRRDVPLHGFPYTLETDDSSPHREALHRRANELSRHANVLFVPRSVVESVEYRDEKFRVVVSTQNENGVGLQTIECDNIVCHTGFRADAQLWRELQIVEHPATGGPYVLAATIMEANRRAGVGLSTGYAEKTPTSSTRSESNDSPINDLRDERNDARLLSVGEPNFYVVGIKSYGRDAGFLMQNGFRQVRDVFKLISGDAQTDLYDGALD